MRATLNPNSRVMPEAVEMSSNKTDKNVKEKATLHSILEAK